MNARRFAWTIVGLLPLSAAARAGPVTWEFAGEVTRAFDPRTLLGGAVEVGSPIAGTVTFESTTPDGDPSPTRGWYGNAVTDVDATMQGLAIAGPRKQDWGGGSNSITVDNGIGSFPDAIEIFTAVDVLGHDYFMFRMRLSDANGKVFVNDALPMSPPDLEHVRTDFSIIDPSETIFGELRIDVNLTQLRLVPEPSAIILLGLCASACVQRRRRKIGSMSRPNGLRRR